MSIMNAANYFCSDIEAGFPPNLRVLQAACGECYEKVTRRLDGVRSAIEDEARSRMNGQERVLRGAMQEAEALAWQTPYPHLFFPALAEEKAAEAERWAVRQRFVAAGFGVQAMAA